MNPAVHLVYLTITLNYLQSWYASGFEDFEKKSSYRRTMILFIPIENSFVIFPLPCLS